MEINSVINGECVAELKLLPSESIDLIFADPPYFLQLQGDLRRPDASLVDAVNDEWDKYTDFDEYDEFTKAWLSEARRTLKTDGSIWVIGSYHNIFRVGKIMQDLGFWVMNDVLWIKSNPMPNFLGTRFNNAHETMIWATKTKNSRPTFNYKTMKSANEDKQMRSDWQIPICSGSERVKINGQKAHSTQKPLALLRRIISSTSKVGDLVLDPFLGSGTTAVAAKELGRNYIGIEREQKYVKVANDRLSATKPLAKELLDLPLEIKPPKVPFGVLVELGMIKPGEMLTNKNGTVSATVDAAGSLRSGVFVGSIHKVGALVQGAISCNGWDFWHLGGEPISEFRSRYLETLND